jgi:ribonuclease HI
MKHGTPAPKEDHDEPLVRVWTDGSSSVRDRSGGWALIAQWEGMEAMRFGYSDSATNITMELTAILRAFQFVRPAPGRRLVIATDSEYSIKALTQWMRQWRQNGWRSSAGRKVANLELLLEVEQAMKHHRQNGTAVTFNWVKGHSGVRMNEEVDKLAGDARIRQRTNWSHDVDAKF